LLNFLHSHLSLSFPLLPPSLASVVLSFFRSFTYFSLISIFLFPLLSLFRLLSSYQPLPYLLFSCLFPFPYSAIIPSTSLSLPSFSPSSASSFYFLFNALIHTSVHSGSENHLQFLWLTVS
jgi:hypothetical protein